MQETCIKIIVISLRDSLFMKKEKDYLEKYNTCEKIDIFFCFHNLK